MRKLYYVVSCWFKIIKMAIHCKRCGFCVNETNVLCEMVDLREALHLFDFGFEPVKVQYESNGERDSFYFRRTAALLMELADYRRAIKQAVCKIDYATYVLPSEISGSMISPIDEVSLSNCFAPRGHVREAFAYESWPAATRKEYIESDTDTRRCMVDDAYNMGASGHDDGRV